MAQQNSQDELNEVEFINSLSDHLPLIPDEIIQYYLNKTGFQCPDVRMIRLISLAAHKFVSDVVGDTKQYHNKDQPPSQRRRDHKVTFTMEHLQRALEDYGLIVKHQEYFIEPTSSAPTKN